MVSENNASYIAIDLTWLDLRSYVLTGKDFPKSATEFQTKMSKTAFQKLTEIDSEIYDVCGAYFPWLSSCADPREY